MGEFVNISTEERVTTMTIDRNRINALSHAVMDELDAALKQAFADPQVKVVIITGGGSVAFVAGADLREMAHIKDAEHAMALATKGQQVFDQIRHATKPVIAAINGVCLGGGLELAMACHLRIVSERARLAQPEINLGIIPGWGGTQRLPRLVGLAKATEMILTGDPITGQEAYRIGLVNAVVRSGDVLKRSRDIARRIASKSSRAVALALQAIHEGLTKDLSAGLALEAQLFGEAARTEDMREGLLAFSEKRQPIFHDR